MATSKQKTRSTTSAKKPAAGKRAASGSGSKRASSAPRSKSRGKRRDYRPRLAGGLICFVLAVFSAFGYFGIDAWLIHLLVSMERGLVGYGYWITPIMLLWAAVILILHNGLPVRLRTTFALLTPAFFGALIQTFTWSGQYTFSPELFTSLWKGGLENSAGGVLGGVLTAVFVKTVSKVGSVLILLVLLFAAGLILLRKTPADVKNALLLANDRRITYQNERRARREEERAYAQSEEDELPAQPAPLFGRRRPVRTSDFDIPVEEGLPNVEAELVEEPPKPRKRILRKPDPVVEEPAAAVAAKPAPAPAPTPAPTPKPAPEEPAAQLKEIFGSKEQRPLFQSDPNVLSNLFRSEPVAVEAPGDAYPARPMTPVQPEPAVEMPPMPDARKAKELERREQAAATEEVSAQAEAGLQQHGGEYIHPDIELLHAPTAGVQENAREEIEEIRDQLDNTFEAFGIGAHVVDAVRGPTVTRFELELERGVKLSKVTNLSDDIALSLGAKSVRIAPVPGKSLVVGVEVPNRKGTPVSIREVLDSPEFRNHESNVAFALGKDIAGRNVVGNISKLPHMLIAGTTGSGKSVCTNSIVISLLYHSSPEQVRMIMIDPKVVEFEGYNGIPHLLIPVVTDPKKAAGALQWAVTNMLKRYQTFAERHVRDLESYNRLVQADPETDEEPLPQIVVIIDELADLMLVASKEVEESICRLAQMGRASGIHLIIATQRPSTDVITGLMKANIPSRIALTVASGLESRIILDTQGAEKLLGHGDMLYSPVGGGKPQRVQGCFISDEEVAAVVKFIKERSESNYDDSVTKEVEQLAENAGKSGKKGGSTLPDSTLPPIDDTPGAPSPEDDDPMMNAAIDVVVETGMASVSMLQRRLKLGYSRAARLVDQMEERGVVGPFEGSKPRKVLLNKEQWAELKMRGGSLTSLDRAKAMSEEADLFAETEAEEESGMSVESEEFDLPPFEVDD